MSTNKPKLSDVARQNNTARASKFASSMIPAPPVQRDAPAPAAEVEPDPLPVVQAKTTESNRETSSVPVGTEDTTPKAEPAAKRDVEPAVEPPPRSTRKRGGNSLSLDDIIHPKAPDNEAFGKMTRISEKHHDLLRKIAYEQRKPMNTILYNLLEILDGVYQRDQQSHA